MTLAYFLHSLQVAWCMISIRPNQYTQGHATHLERLRHRLVSAAFCQYWEIAKRPSESYQATHRFRNKSAHSLRSQTLKFIFQLLCEPFHVLLI